MTTRDYRAPLALVMWTLTSAVGPGCNQTLSDAIPCRSDTNCPTDYFCDAAGECASAESGSPAQLELVGVAMSATGAPAPAITFVEGGRMQSFYVVLRNAGRSQAAYPEVTFSAPVCLGMKAELASNLVGILDPGETRSASAYVDPEPACASPITVDVTMAVGGGSLSPLREARGSFTVLLR
jgi:hypothetical protein